MNGYPTNESKLIAHADHPHTDGNAPAPPEANVPELEEQSIEVMTSPPPAVDSTSDLPSFNPAEACSIESCSHSSDSTETLETGASGGISFQGLVERMPITPAETLLGVIILAPLALHTLRRQLKA